MLYAVIMSGGSGTRFWPRSRTSMPKQLLPLVNGRSLLEETVSRVLPAIPGDNIFVITNCAQGEETRRQLKGQVPAENIILEPVGRDTAACIGLAAALLKRRDPDAVLVVLPADHLISPRERFNELIQQAATQATPGRVLTLGARPSYPATGFGYIEQGEILENSRIPLHAVSTFKEKPKLELAEQYVAAKSFLWNCGIFIWRADTVLDELRKSKPSLLKDLEVIAERFGEDDFASVLDEKYRGLEKISIDYAVLENCQSIGVLAIDFEWNDLGSWSAVETLHEPNDEGHRVWEAEHISVDSEGCFIVGDGKMIATVGVKDLVVVQTKDATLIVHRDKVQQVKDVVGLLEAKGREDLLR
ncbi:MAG: mannose-1-phosphate guanylyltransferase [Planctomycetota bacterium]|nr:mannose-1-phosphate guanylyltransferase [Planctomycetota bacterium]